MDVLRDRGASYIPEFVEVSFPVAFGLGLVVVPVVLALMVVVAYGLGLVVVKSHDLLRRHFGVLAS